MSGSVVYLGGEGFWFDIGLSLVAFLLVICDLGFGGCLCDGGFTDFTL